MRLGGPAGLVVEARTEAGLIAAAAARPALLLAGGSNVVAADDGIPGTVVLVRTRGVTVDGDLVTVAAGEPWDAFVARMIEDGRPQLACLSGIPGSAGATPIQNVGAYGAEVAATIASVRVLEPGSGDVLELAAGECGFSYRSSVFKREPGRFVVLAVSFDLPRSGEGCPVHYGELAAALGVPPEARAAPGRVRDAVLALRRRKGMVLDPADPDTRSAGSFFTNPILDPDAFAALSARAPSPPPSWPEADGRIKTSAAWLIERAGFTKGYGDPAGIAISSKHVLALTNRGDGTTAALLALAREIAAGVEDRFGITLVPEPVLAGCRL